MEMKNISSLLRLVCLAMSALLEPAIGGQLDISELRCLEEQQKQFAGFDAGIASNGCTLANFVRDTRSRCLAMVALNDADFCKCLMAVFELKFIRETTSFVLDKRLCESGLPSIAVLASECMATASQSSRCRIEAFDQLVGLIGVIRRFRSKKLEFGKSARQPDEKAIIQSGMVDAPGIRELSNLQYAETILMLSCCINFNDGKPFRKGSELDDCFKPFAAKALLSDKECNAVLTSDWATLIRCVNLCYSEK